MALLLVAVVATNLSNAGAAESVPPQPAPARPDAKIVEKAMSTLEDDLRECTRRAYRSSKLDCALQHYRLLVEADGAIKVRRQGGTLLNQDELERCVLDVLSRAPLPSIGARYEVGFKYRTMAGDNGCFIDASVARWLSDATMNPAADPAVTPGVVWLRLVSTVQRYVPQLRLAVRAQDGFDLELPLCLAPCDRAIDARNGVKFVVGGDDIVTSAPFALGHLQGPVTASVVAGDQTVRSAGALFAILGVLGTGVGTTMYMIDRDSPERSSISPALAWGGVASMVLGGVIAYSQRTSVTLSQGQAEETAIPASQGGLASALSPKGREGIAELFGLGRPKNEERGNGLVKAACNEGDREACDYLANANDNKCDRAESDCYTKEEVGAEIGKLTETIRSCYERELLHQEKCGTVRVRFVFDHHGHVLAAVADEDTLTLPAVTSCILDAFGQLRFTPRARPQVVDVTHPYNLNTNGGCPGGP